MHNWDYKGVHNKFARVNRPYSKQVYSEVTLHTIKLRIIISE